MAIINVDDAYILNETGAQVDKTTGIPFKNESLTEAEAAQARANIRAGGSNRNLLDNWYFVGGGSQLGDGVFPINQRGQSTYTGGGTQLDRWKTWDGSDTIVLTANGLQYTSPASNGIFQYFPVDLPTNTMTFSVKVSGTIYSVTIAEGTTEARTNIPGGEILVNRPNKAAGIISHNATLLLQAAKLEVGTVSTLANDPPPDFGEELRKCQRYLWVHTFAAYDVVGNGYAASATIGGFSIYLPVSMRTGGNPQATYTTLPSAYGGGNASNLSVMNIASLTGNIARYYVEFSGMQANNAICVMATANTTLTISAEL